MSATNLLKRSIALCAALSLALLIAVSLTGRAEAVEVIDAAEAWIEIEMHKGSLVRLPEAAVTVFIANPEIADIQVKSPTLIYVFGKRAGETALYAVGAGENILANLGIRVSHNLGRLREVVAESGLDAEIEVASVAGTLVVTGMAHSAAAAEEVRRLAAQFVGTEDGFLMRVGVDAPNQVNLRVRIAEVSRSAIKQFGINWDAVFSSGNFLIGLATGQPGGCGRRVRYPGKQQQQPRIPQMDCQFDDLLGRFCYKNQCNTIIATGQTRLTLRVTQESSLCGSISTAA